MKNKDNQTIVLIGPMSAGKSTIARELAKITSLPRIPMDRVRWYYYLTDGFSLEKEESIDSFTDVMTYWKPFEVKAVKRILREFPNSIIDFGAGHSHYTDEKQLKEVQAAMEPFDNVFLLMPSDDCNESLEICNARLKERVNRDLDKAEIDANFDFINSISNKALAKHIIYTKGKTPTDTALEIKSILKL